MFRCFVLSLALAFALASCGPTPRKKEPGLAELYEAAPRGPLPGGVRPTAYEMDLTIDPRKERFGGTVTIDLEFDKPADGVWLHGQGLEIRDVRVTSELLEDESATWRDVLNSGVAWINFPRRVSSGSAEVSIR